MNFARFLLLLFSLSICSWAGAQTPAAAPFARYVKWVMDGHIQPQTLNDTFSANVFDAFVESLDTEGLLFTAGDMALLGKHRLDLDAEMQGKSWGLIPATAPVLTARLAKAKALLTSLVARPIDLNGKATYAPALDTIYAPALDTIAPATEALWEARWAQGFRYELLQSMAKAWSAARRNGAPLSTTTLLAKEPLFRKRLASKWQKLFLGEEGAPLTQRLYERYCSAVLHCLDPHSSYFDGASMADFKKDLSTEGLFFGFSLRDNDRDEIEIRNVSPGSAAWASGKLHPGDVLTEMQWQTEPVDLAGMDAADVSEMLGSISTQPLTLRLRRQNGLHDSVVLRKAKSENTWNSVHGFMLRGAKPTGYILLPSFYTEWEGGSGSSCAADVAREVVRLKAAGMTGLILDLRYNGGGSIQEAIELAGIFIDEGAVGQVRTRDGKVQALKDMNRGVIYSGPLVVLINGQSASASEMVAACLQDHQRAVVAGSRSFGKATGQSISPTPSNGNAPSFVKLTNIRLYRPLGGSVQGRGVAPDLTIVNEESGMYTESDMPYTLKGDSVSPYKYFKPVPPRDLSSVRSKSRSRVAASPRLSALQKLLDADVPTAPLSLRWADWETFLQKTFNALPTSADMRKPSTLYTVEPLKAPAGTFESNAVNTALLEVLHSDPVLEEAVQIIIDLQSS